MTQRVRKHPHRRHTVPALFDTQHRSVPAMSQTDLELLRQSQANPAARGFVMHLQTHIGNQATQRVLMRVRQSTPNTVQRSPYLRPDRHMIQRAPDEAAPAAPAATADAPAHDPADWSNFVSSEIQSFLDEFQSIYVVVSPPDADEMVFETVHPPYYLNAVYTENSKKRIEAAETARETAPEYVKSQLFKKDKKGVDQPTALARGRSQLEDIRKLVQGALDRGLIPASGGKQYPDHKDLRAWLKQYGIGVDCSAFVQQALVRLVQASYAAAGETPNRKGNYGVGSIQSSAVLKDIEKELKKNDRFEAVETPGEARPGDVLTKKGHIRIVMSVENTDDGGVVITFAESTSASDRPAGESVNEADIGPRAYMVKYPDASKPIKDQIPLVKRSHEKNFRKQKSENKYRLGRLKALEQFHSEHAAPEEAQEAAAEEVENNPAVEAQVDSALQAAQDVINQKNAN